MRVRFFPTSTNLRACERGSCSATLVGQVSGNSTVYDGACGVRWGGFEGEGGFADFFAVEGEDRESGELGVDRARGGVRNGESGDGLFRGRARVFEGVREKE